MSEWENQIIDELKSLINKANKADQLEKEYKKLKRSFHDQKRHLKEVKTEQGLVELQKERNTYKNKYKKACQVLELLQEENEVLKSNNEKYRTR